MLVVFSHIFVADTKITFVYNFAAPLMVCQGVAKFDEHNIVVLEL